MSTKDTHTRRTRGDVAVQVSHSRSGGVLKDLTARAAYKAAPHTRPWLIAAALLPASAATHYLWGDPGIVPWASAALSISGAGLTWLTWKVSPRRTLGRLQATLSTAAASSWMVAGTIVGPTQRPLLDIGLWAGGTLCAAWNLRNIVGGAGDGEPGDGDTARALFKRLFVRHGPEAGVNVRTVRGVRAEPNKVVGTVQLDGTDTTEDLQGAVARIEAAASLPPGSLTVSRNPKDASAPTAVISNPLLLEDPIPWPGPSAPGESIAKPLQLGLFQDGTPCLVQIPGIHMQVMGMTGAAKTTGAGWTFWAEIGTRSDVVLIVADITKGKQTLDPAGPMLHSSITRKDTLRKLIDEWLPEWSRERLDRMGERGLITWQEGCGLPYLVLWLEEAADVFDAVDPDKFGVLARMIRSAGGTLVWSLQRADHTQMPTFIRGQGGAFVCLGVANAHDAKWGLSEAQADAGAAPELWANRRPGMAYVDAPGVPPTHFAIPMRFFDWGKTNEERVAAFAAHCQKFAVEKRGCPLDPATEKLLERIRQAEEGETVTVTITGNDGEPPGVGDVVSEYLTIPDPNPDITADPEAPLEPVPDVPLGGGTKLPPKQARQVLEEKIAQMDGWVAPRDLRDVLETTGMTRQWLQKHLRRLVAEGRLEHNPETGEYRLVAAMAAA